MYLAKLQIDMNVLQPVPPFGWMSIILHVRATFAVLF